ncbi:hypothetical protein MMC11_002017 [Xylographa trunciseda]|nr:hypothetical protein [Xylographa trunciseda]
MASNTTPWHLRPGFLAVSNPVAAPGDPLRYDSPRPFPVTDPSDRTSYHPGQRAWSVDNFPEILYQIYPDDDWYRFMNSGLPEPKIDRYGRVAREAWPVDPSQPRMLLNFTILPDQIGTKESQVFFEIWRRWDPRIRWIDITMRMNRNRPTENALNSALQRLRLSYSLLSWPQMWRNIEGNTLRDRVVAALPMCAIEANSSRGHTPGLVVPWMGEDGGRVPRPSVKPHVTLRIRHHTVADTVPRESPSRSQLPMFGYAAPGPGMSVTQGMTGLLHYDPRYEDLFDWDNDMNVDNEARTDGNLDQGIEYDAGFPMNGPNPGILLNEYDNEPEHGNGYMYNTMDYGNVGLDDSTSGQVYPFPGTISTLSGHENHSPQFCMNNCFPIPLDSLPEPFRSFLP